MKPVGGRSCFLPVNPCHANITLSQQGEAVGIRHLCLYNLVGEWPSIENACKELSVQGVGLRCCIYFCGMFFFTAVAAILRPPIVVFHAKLSTMTPEIWGLV